MPLCRCSVTLALAAAAAAAQAEPVVTFVQDLSAPRTAVTRVDFYGTADRLAGARAMVLFNDGSRDEAMFVVTGSGPTRIATAETTAFVVSALSDAVVDDSQPEDWLVANLDTRRTLVGFSIELAREGTAAAFDTYFGANLLELGTPGSSTGRSLQMDFRGRSFLAGSYTVTYSQPIALQGATPVGDLFGRVDVRLAYSNATLNGGLPPNSPVFSSQRFFSDLDLVVYAQADAPPPASLPLPGTAVLAVAALALLRRRR